MLNLDSIPQEEEDPGNGNCLSNNLPRSMTQMNHKVGQPQVLILLALQQVDLLHRTVDPILLNFQQLILIIQPTPP